MGPAGMDVTPGGRDESLVPAGKRLGAEVEVAERVQLLIATLTITVYNYVAQVCLFVPSSSPLQLWGCRGPSSREACKYGAQP